MGTFWYPFKIFFTRKAEANVYVAFTHVCRQMEGYFFEDKEMPGGIFND